MQKVELMSPAGSYESLIAAIQAGADSVYLGVESLNMRRRAAKNFVLKDLPKVMKICRKNKIKGYLTLNTIIYDKDIKEMRKICNIAKKAGIDAIITHDIAVLRYCKSENIPIHISTQANISNIEAVRFYSQFADVMVLARELSLEQVRDIAYRIRKEKIRCPNGKLVRIELFAHGALCVSIAGKCYMSLATYNQPANRGECLQNCRRAYRVYDDETGDELIIDNKYVMSPKDLCTIAFLDKLIAAGASILKIEGRGRAPDYVYNVTKAYREAIDSIYDGSYTKKKVDAWTRQLEKVFNRGFWHGGYYLGKRLGEWSGVYGSKATREKVYVGVVKNYFKVPKVAHILIETGSITVGDSIMVTGPTTGVVEARVDNIKGSGRNIYTAKRGQDVTIPIDSLLRKNDKVYVISEKKVTTK